MLPLRSQLPCLGRRAPPVPSRDGQLLYCLCPGSWWQQFMLRKPPFHSQPREQERCLVSFCLSIVCLYSVRLGCPSTCGFLCLWAGGRGGRGGRAGWCGLGSPQVLCLRSISFKLASVSLDTSTSSFKHALASDTRWPRPRLGLSVPHLWNQLFLQGALIPSSGEWD